MRWQFLEKIFGDGENFRTRDSLAYLLKTYQIVGLNRPKQRAWWPLFYAHAVLNFADCVVIGPIVYTLNIVFEAKTMTLPLLLSAIQGALNVYGVPFKALAVTYYFKRLKASRSLMDIMDSRCTRDDELQRMRACVRHSNTILMIFVVSFGVYDLSTCFTAFINGRPPFALYMPFNNWQNSRKELIVQEVYEFFVLTYLLIFQMCNDAYALIFITILRTHMRILVERVKRLGADDGRCKTQQQHLEELIACVVDHHRLLELFNIVSPVISLTIFTQLLITAAIISIVMINIFIFGDGSTIISYVFYFCAVLMQFSPCCYLAHALKFDSEKLPLALYESNWMDQDVRYQRMLAFFMQHTQQPMTLTAMKILPIDLTTFVNIAKFSFSLYTLFKNFDFNK